MRIMTNLNIYSKCNFDISLAKQATTYTLEIK